MATEKANANLWKKRARPMPVTPSSALARTSVDSRLDSGQTDHSDAETLANPKVKRLKTAHAPSPLNFISSPQADSPSSYGSPLSTGDGPRRRSQSKEPQTTQAATVPNSDVICNLRVSFDGRMLGGPIEVPIDWYSSASYDVVEKASVARLKENEYSEDTYTLYRKSGLCRIIRHAIRFEREGDEAGKLHERHCEQEIGCYTALDKKEWLELQFPIMSYRGKFKYDHFHLQIEWNYSGFEKLNFDADDFEKEIRDNLAEKLKYNWCDEQYISRKDLDEIMSEEVVELLINRDESLKGLGSHADHPSEVFDRESFIRDIINWSTKTLAICVFARLPLACLWQMRQMKIKDENLPLSMKTKSMLKGHGKEFKDFLKWQGAFVAHLFQTPQHAEGQANCRYRKVDDKVVLPISFDKLKDRRGEGSYGNVYEVEIDPDHHDFTEVKHAKFALKIFHDNGSQTQSDFHRESTMLDELSNIPHDHVVPHLASFTHGGKFYMLFPLAICNLKHYLENESTPKRNQDFVLWLAGQMKGLASAVSHLHHLGKRIAEDPIASQMARVPSRERTCFHHDLKPENLLIFRSEQTGGLILKISDFGSGRVGRLRSGMKGSMFTKNPSVGTLEYEAPDWMIDQKSSRPYDIWSLGCIFLELLLWTFEVQRNEEFASERLQTKDHENNVGHSTKFWYIDASLKLRLKPAVERSLRVLRSRCKTLGIFHDAVSTTRRMLRVTPHKRPKAHDVDDDFKAICLQAKRDLADDPDFYLKNGQRSIEVAAPLSAVGSQPSRSRSASAERSGERIYNTHHLSPPSPSMAKSQGHGKSLSISIPIGDHDHNHVYRNMGIMPAITAVDTHSSSDEDDLEYSPVKSPTLGKPPEILLNAARMDASSSLSVEAVRGITEGTGLALQTEVQRALEKAAE